MALWSEELQLLSEVEQIIVVSLSATSRSEYYLLQNTYLWAALRGYPA